MIFSLRRLLAYGTLAMLVPATVDASEMVFEPVADGIHAFIGDKGGRTYENEGLNANIGLIVTPAGAVVIDSRASRRSAAAIHAAVKRH